MKYVILLLTLTAASAVSASPGNDGCVGNCPTAGGGGSTEVNNTVNINNTKVQVNNSIRDNSVTNEATGGKGGKANSSATGGSVGDTSATGGSVGNVKSTSTSQGGSATGGSVGNTTSTVGDTLSTATGGSIGDTTSTVGDTTSTVGDTTSTVGDTSAVSTGGSVGDTTSTVGDTLSQSNNDNTSSVGNTASESNNSNNSAGGDVEFNYTSTTADNAASSAASVLTGYCQSGGSAQGMNGGFTLTGNDQFCDRIRMADYYWIQYNRQVDLASAFACNHPIPALSDRCTKIGERMLTSIDKAWENTEEANQLLDSGKFAAQVEKATGPFARIGGILALLVLL